MTAIASPHVSIRYKGPRGEKLFFADACAELPPRPRRTACIAACRRPMCKSSVRIASSQSARRSSSRDCARNWRPSRESRGEARTKWLKLRGGIAWDKGFEFVP